LTPLEDGAGVLEEASKKSPATQLAVVVYSYGYLWKHHQDALAAIAALSSA